MHSLFWNRNAQSISSDTTTFVHVHVDVSTLTFRLSATGRYCDSIIDVLIS